METTINKHQYDTEPFKGKHVAIKTQVISFALLEECRQVLSEDTEEVDISNIQDFNQLLRDIAEENGKSFLLAKSGLTNSFRKKIIVQLEP